MVLWNLVALRTLGFRQNDKKSEILLGSNVPRGDRGSSQQSVRTRVTKNLLFAVPILTEGIWWIVASLWPAE